MPRGITAYVSRTATTVFDAALGLIAIGTLGEVPAAGFDVPTLVSWLGAAFDHVPTLVSWLGAASTRASMLRCRSLPGWWAASPSTCASRREADEEEVRLASGFIALKRHHTVL